VTATRSPVGESSRPATTDVLRDRTPRSDDGKVVGDGRIERTTPMPFSGDESLDLGDELGSPVTTDCGERKFTGTVNWVEIDVGMDDHNHLISPEERLNLALAFH
jgi:hypothetical protein